LRQSLVNIHKTKTFGGKKGKKKKRRGGKLEYLSHNNEVLEERLAALLILRPAKGEGDISFLFYVVRYRGRKEKAISFFVGGMKGEKKDGQIYP